MLKTEVNYEGHIFNPCDCNGWSYSGRGFWYVSIGKPEEDRCFTTKNNPIKPGGLADQIKEAKLLKN